MDPNILFSLLTLLTSLALLYFLSRGKQKPQKPFSDFSSSSESDEETEKPSWRESESDRNERRERERKAQEAKQKRKEDAVKTVLSSDPMFANALQDLSHVDPAKLVSATDQNVVQEIARNIPDDILHILKVAATQQDITFNLEKSEEREPVMYPTSDMTPETTDDLDKIPFILPTQLAADDDEFYQDLAKGEMHVLQPYERRREEKVLEIVWDISPSMEESMHGQPGSKNQWSRGILLSLLAKAQKGKAKYFLRPFHGRSERLMSATTPEEAKELLYKLLIPQRYVDASGTNITGALTKAVEDIRTKGGAFTNADILLISDGEDDNLDPRKIKRLLGEDINLHALLIGSQSESLEKIAKSYRVFK